jgi:hypothetical protein
MAHETLSFVLDNFVEVVAFGIEGPEEPTKRLTTKDLSLKF